MSLPDGVILEDPADRQASSMIQLSPVNDGKRSDFYGFEGITNGTVPTALRQSCQTLVHGQQER